ncbi:MAG: cell division protein FtsA [Hyphomicrobiaceae bacterium]
MLNRSEHREANERIVTFLDIGTSKICCMIVALPRRLAGPHRIGQPLPGRVLGFGYGPSKGIKAGLVVDLTEAEQAIRSAVDRAEERAGIHVEQVVVSVTAGRLRSTTFSASADVGRRTVAEADIARALAAGRAFAERDGRTLLHMHRLGYRLDAETGIRNPRGMTGERLSVDLNAVTADDPPLRNLVLLVERCFLSVAAMIATPYASALSVMTADEAQLGVTVIDMGAGATTVALFAEGQFIHADAVAIGGSHISFDIARALSTPLHVAERIKTFYGNLVGAASDEHELIPYSIVGEDDGLRYHTSKARIRRIIRPRIEETLEVVAERLLKSGCADYSGGRVVLTGGAAQLAGLPEFAQQVLGRTVRVAAPRPFGDLPESATTPPFATVHGLGHALITPGIVAGAIAESASGAPSRGYLGQVTRWFMESFWDDDRQGESHRR